MKDCNFCGSKIPKVKVKDKTEGNIKYYIVFCDECACNSGYYNSDIKAEETWDA